MIDFGQMGDVIMSLPVLTAVRRKFPSAHLTVMTGKVPDEVVRLSGLADEVIAVDRVDLRDGPKLRSILKIKRFVREIRRREIDLVIDLHSLAETNLLAYLTRARHRLLANRENRSIDRLSNFRPRPPREDKTKHLTDRYFDVVRPLGIEGGKKEYRFPVDERTAAEIKARFFRSDAKTIGLFPGAGHPSRCWPLKKFAQVAAKLRDDGFEPAVFLGPEEAGMRPQVEELFPAETVVIDGLTIKEFIAATADLAAFVTNDTGPMHLAACAGAPIVLIPDMRTPTIYLPLTDKLEIVRAETIDQITVENVLTATQKLVSVART